MSRRGLQDRIENWVRRIVELKAEIELTMTYLRNEKIIINLSEAADGLAKGYNMLLATSKELSKE